MNNLKVDITHENGKYNVTVNGNLEYDTRDFSKVQEGFDVDTSYAFAEAVRLVFVNNKDLIERLKPKKCQE